MFYIMTLALSAFIFTACQDDWRLDPDRPGLAPAPAITGANANTPPAHGVTLTAVPAETTSDEIISWQWSRGTGATGVGYTIIPGQTGPTLLVQPTDSTYPYGGFFRVAAVTNQGVGPASLRHEVRLVAPELPIKPTITKGANDTVINGVIMNWCPSPAVMLTARSPFATEFLWFLDGDTVRNVAGAPIRTATLSIMGVFDTLGVQIGETDGIYTVQAINHLGVVESDPVNVEWVDCADFSAEIEFAGRFTDTAGVNFALADVVLGSDVDSVKIAVIPGVVLPGDIATLKEELADGTISSVVLRASSNGVSVPFLGAPDTYSFVLITIGRGKVQEFIHYSFVFPPVPTP